jgi:ATP-binding cassette subfamily G (WHITE) protein 2 (PDR)
MYDPAAYSLSVLLVEIPWLGLIVFSATSVGYFMYKLTPGGFFFHYLVSFTLAVVYLSIGTFVSAVAATFEVAQAILGLLGPLFFLFGGLWSPPSQMVPGARWFTYIDPITYVHRGPLSPPPFVKHLDDTWEFAW